MDGRGWALRILLITGFLLAAGSAGAEAAICRQDKVLDVFRPSDGDNNYPVTAYEIITEGRVYYKLLGPDAARSAAWREGDAIMLCQATAQTGLYKITNKRLGHQLDAERTTPPITPLLGVMAH
jgi:hypothetical protein